MPMDCREDSAQDAAARCGQREDSFGVSRPQSVFQWAGASVKQLRKLLSKGSTSAAEGNNGRQINSDAMVHSSADEVGQTVGLPMVYFSCQSRCFSGMTLSDAILSWSFYTNCFSPMSALLEWGHAY
jgi:hypothetical protein